MIQGSCLCGGVKFEIQNVTGPFELCHCSKCRKTSGSAFFAAVTVARPGFRFLQGEELINVYEAPIQEKPPSYKSAFCKNCGSPVPDPGNKGQKLEVPAGSLDGDLAIRPDKHIYTEVKANCHEITDALPQLNREELSMYRGSMKR